MSAKAQTALPTAWSFSSTTLPAFWTDVNANSTTYPVPYYSASGHTPPAYKFDGTGDMLTIFFSGNPGNLTYWIAGNSFAGGTFLVQESTNGTTWTTLHSHTAIATAYTLITDVPNTATRYIRFNYSAKVTGNVGLDDVNIDAGAATPAQEINVKQGSTTIVTGGSYMFSSPVGTTTPVIFSIENLGTVNPLTITSATITGAAASEFTLTIVPSTIAATTASNLAIDFNPTSTGTRTVTLTIGNDDSDENPYIINLTGLGGSYFTEPATQGTALAFSNIKSYRAKASFVASSSSPTGYLILKKEGSSAITEVPVDGSQYMIGDAIGSTKVISTSSSTSIGISNIYAGKTYQIAVFAYNGNGSFINYKQTSPLLGSVTASGSMQSPTKYTSLNVNNSNFLTSLSALIYPHTSTFYGNYDETMIRLFAQRDTTGGQKVVTCVYSSENYVYNEPFVWGHFSREHSYCHNWMPTNPADGTGTAPNNVERKEYNDQHHLFPTNQNDANAPRSNYPQGDIVGTPSTTYLACKAGNDINGNHIFEPRAQHKGDFARAIMYMATAYNTQLDAYGVAQNWKLRNPISTSIAYGQDQNLLKKWHFQDLPDSWEISRNDFLDSLQGNRNPFIDSVRYACYIDFSNMTYISAPTYTTGTNAPCYVAVGIKENVATQFEYVLAPNPTSGEFYLLIDAKLADKFSLAITDITGRIVYAKPVDVINGFNSITVNDLKLSGGVYFVNLTYKNEKITRKLIIQ
jgi:endonuclease I